MGSAIVALSCILLVNAAAPEDFATASSIRRTEHAPFYAVDGLPDTRWSSDTAKPTEWYQLDLGTVVSIDGVRIYWEGAFPLQYTLQSSEDGSEWQELYRQQDGTGGTEVREDLGGRGRYVRFLFTEPNFTHLYSIWEIEFLNPEARAALATQVRHVEESQQQKMEREQAVLRAQLSEAGVDEIIFVTRRQYKDMHWYANIGYYADDDQDTIYVHGAGLYKLHVPSGAVTPLIEDPDGTLRDPVVHYDGRTILFAWRKGGSRYFHLYTIQSDGSGLKQITSGEYDDFEPAWMPDGDIVFVSTRARRWVNCWYTQVATVHRCGRDGRNILSLSANLEHDNTPWPLPDGRILYTRWEYIDRSQVDYHHLWTMNPDGTNEMVYFGNMHPGGLYIDAKPIPGTQEVLTINSPKHGKPEHVGYVAIVNAKHGPDDPSAMHTLAEGLFCDPYPITSDLFMAARQDALAFVNRAGEVSVLHKLDKEQRPLKIYEPRPLIARPLEPVIPPKTDHTKRTGQLVLANAHVGRNMATVEPGQIKKLLVLEALPKPINYSGSMEPITYGGSFSLERVLGTVPVEEDGSAYVELPAHRSLFFVAMDADMNAVKRMQSFLTVMPGEVTSCVGCHEQRTQTFANPGSETLQALQRPPSAIEPIPGIPGVFDFPRDIQPILDKHCVSCHDYAAHGGGRFGPRAGGVVLCGDRGPVYSHSYVTLTTHGQVADGRNQPKGNRAPRTIGASASPLFQKIVEGHHDVELSPHEVDLVRYWIETGAPYPGTYGAMGCGAIGGLYAMEYRETDYEWPESVAAADVIENRCNACHGGMELPRYLAEEIPMPTDDDAQDNPRQYRNRHLLFNLTRPAMSLALLAPLAEDGGGYGLCKDGDGTPVFESANDAGYQSILAMCTAGQRRLETIKRFDMAGFQPPPPYIREMKRYGVLPKDLPSGAPVDPYAADRAYWRMFE